MADEELKSNIDDLEQKLFDKYLTSGMEDIISFLMWKLFEGYEDNEAI